MAKQKNAKKKKLSFLKRFLKGLGLKMSDIPPSIINLGALKMALRADTLHLSVIRRIVEHFDHVLFIRLTPRYPIYRPGTTYKRHNPNLNLSFLREYISKMGLNNAQFAESIGVSTETVIYWFRMDDITLKRLYEIAYLMDADLQISINPKPRKEIIGPKVRTTLTLIDEHPISPSNS